MYQVDAWSALRRTTRTTAASSSRLKVSPNVIALGFTSLLTDAATEMVNTVLPIYLVLYLGMTPLSFGVIDGMAQGLTATLHLFTGFASDRFRRCKDITLFGYGLSALTKLLLVGLGGSALGIALLVAADRVGKAIRTVPRDLLISFSSEPSQLGTTFGVHRSMDSAGAMLGPLIALAILYVLPTGFDVVFVTSGCVAVCGLAALWIFVHNVAAPRAAMVVPMKPVQITRRLFATPGLPRLIVAVGLLAATSVSDAFIYLVLQRNAGFNAGLLPLLYIGTATGYLILAVPVGQIADRIGRQQTFLAGYAMLIGTYALALYPASSTGLTVAACLLLLGGFYAMTDGVLMAMVSSICPEEMRGSGMAMATTTVGLGRLIASVVFGALWTIYGTTTALAVFTGGLCCAVAASRVLLPSAAGQPGTGQ